MPQTQRWYPAHPGAHQRLLDLEYKVKYGERLTPKESRELKRLYDKLKVGGMHRISTENPHNPIPSRWTPARVMRTRRGEVKIMLPVKARNPRPKSLYKIVRSKNARGESTWFIVNQRGERVGALAGYTTKQIAQERARRM